MDVDILNCPVLYDRVGRIGRSADSAAIVLLVCQTCPVSSRLNGAICPVQRQVAAPPNVEYTP